MKKFFKLLLLTVTLIVSLGADTGSTSPQPSAGSTSPQPSEGSARLLPSLSNPVPSNISNNISSTPTSLLTATERSAKPSAPKSAATPPALPSMGVAIFRMVGSLAIVIALFFVGAWVFRNMHRFKAPGATNRKLQVLEAKSLGPRQAVYVVGYEQQRLLIGATPQGLTLLTHLPEGAPQPHNQPEQPAGQRILPVSFGEALMQALGRK